MKKVKIHYVLQKQDAEAFIIETKEDLKEFASFLVNSAKNVTLGMVKSTLPVGKLDHIVHNFKATERALAKMAVVQAQTRETNPIYEVDNAVEYFLKGITSAVLRGEKVLLNESGGWCTETDQIKIVEFLDEERLEPFVDMWIDVFSDYITIENDAELEEKAVEQLKKLQKQEPFSYITQLRTFSKEELLDLFKMFVGDGNTPFEKTLYVYTTGLDWKQAEEFYLLAVEAGIKKIQVQMSDVLSADYLDVLERISFLKDVKVELLNVNNDKEIERARRLLAKS